MKCPHCNKDLITVETVVDVMKAVKYKERIAVLEGAVRAAIALKHKVEHSTLFVKELTWIEVAGLDTWLRPIRDLDAPFNQKESSYEYNGEKDT